MPAVAQSPLPFSQLFYGRVFQLAPAARGMFKGDIAAQGVKLTDMLGTLVASLDRREEVIPVLHALGQRHEAYGVQPAHYAVVTAALLWTLRQVLQEDFPAETEQAWAALLDTVSQVMMEGARTPV